VLKILMLRKKIDQRKEALAALAEDEKKLQERSQALEGSIDEAKTDEELSVVEEEVKKVEAEKTSIAEKKSKLEGEIAALEGEIEQLNTKAPDTSNPIPEPRAEDRGKLIQGGDIRMKRGFFRDWTIEQRNAFVARDDVKEFLTRVRSLASEKRAVTGAELTIPEVMLDLLRDNLYRYSKLVSKVNVRTVGGKARQNIMGAVPEGIWTEAVGKLNELALTFNQVEVDGYKVGGYIALPNPTLQDSDLNLAAEILDAIGQAIGLGVDKAILYGTGVKMPLGIATRLAQTVQPGDWGANAPAWTNLSVSNLLKFDPSGLSAEQFFATLIKNLGTARPNYARGGTFWAMNRKTRMEILSRAVTFNASGALVAGVNNTMPIEGGDIVELPFIPDNDIIGGYGSLYLLAERAGASLAASEHVKFIEDQTVFKGTARYDGMPVFGEAFVIVNIANTAPTTSVAFAPDAANP